jgi:hypothetical protein
VLYSVCLSACNGLCTFGRLIAPRGFESLNENSKPIINKELTENTSPVLDTSLDKTLQKHPELAQLIKTWPELPEHIKAAIKALIQIHK